jgi:hypothetical protein
VKLNHPKYFLAGLLLLLAAIGMAQDADSTYADAQPVYYDNSYKHADSSPIDKRNFSKSDLQDLKSDSDLNYKEPPTVAESLWDRFVAMLIYFWQWLLRTLTATAGGRLLMYLIGLALLIAIVMMLLKVDAVRVFFSGADGAASYQVLHENIHEMDFETLIREAITRNEFRQGTRLVFLYALKILSDTHHIQWVPGKTNHEYVEELTQSELKKGFNELSFYFDYAWYGNFQVTPDLFQKVENTFHELKSKVS